MAVPKNDTICALATPPGIGGIGVFRVSGPDAFSVCDQVLRHRRACASHLGHTLHRAQVVDGSDVIDDVLVSVFHAPRSYTGEDVVELSCHGGPVVLGRVLGRLLAAGARPAERGEFTLRAYLNGKMDLAQAEAVSDIVAARTDEALRLARRQQAGSLSATIGGIRDQILGVLARVEASIDFPEDVGDLDEAACRLELRQTDEMMTALTASAKRGIITREGARVTLAGRPNAGKSSLMNALLRMDRALVTAIPGTTRDMIEETLTIRGIPVRLQDTAGLHQTEDFVEQLGIEKTNQTLAAADLVLYVVDAALGLSAQDENALSTLGACPCLLIWNKCDLPEALPPFPAVAVSALTGQGLERLEQSIYEAITGEASDLPDDAPRITHTRHLNALLTAQARIADARSTLDQSLPADLLSIDLQGALTAIGTVTGQTAQEEMIAEIFSRFCIGK